MSEKKVAVLNITEALIEKDSYDIFICYNRASPLGPHSLRIVEFVSNLMGQYTPLIPVFLEDAP